MKATGHEVEPKFWDAKKRLIKNTCVDASFLNVALSHKKSEVIQYLIYQEINGIELTVSSAKKSLQIKGFPKEDDLKGMKSPRS
jgi:hypothetical protein